MSIRDWGEKINPMSYFGKIRNTMAEKVAKYLPINEESSSKYFTGAIVVLVGLSSFGLGRLSLLDERQTPITVLSPDISGQTASVAQSISLGGKLVASRSGTKYYFPWCSSNIAEKNKIWFNSEAEAKAKGYEPAANCKGLK